MATSKETTGMISRTARSRMNLRPMMRVFVFQIPTRVFHWLNAFCILVLICTGYLIGDPPAVLHSTEAYVNNWFGFTRFLHFATAWIFTFNWIFRIFWAMIGGNQWETWKNFIPVTKKRWVEMKKILIQDIFLLKREEHVSIGHNALAGFSYFMLFLVVVAMIITGFGLYADSSTSILVTIFAWASPVFGNDASIRFIHHALMWIFVIFSIIHIYLVFFHDFVEGRGETSSIIGGWKFIEKKLLDKKNE
jgi:Ni/Fe-hydrogenase 1 B-type cytochrome subunit